MFVQLKSYFLCIIWWGSLLEFVLSTSNRLYIGWFGLLMFPLVGVALFVFILG